jgi:hypothetical protein
MNGTSAGWYAELLAANQVELGLVLRCHHQQAVHRALKALFGGAVSKDTVSRVWRKVKADWDYAIQLSKPSAIFLPGRLRPMKTMRLSRFSSLFHGRW